MEQACNVTEHRRPGGRECARCPAYSGNAAWITLPETQSPALQPGSASGSGVANAIGARGHARPYCSCFPGHTAVDGSGTTAALDHDWTQGPGRGPCLTCSPNRVSFEDL